MMIAGLVIAAAGAILWLSGRAGLFRLPGDIELSGENWRVFVPITTCLLVSAVLTALLWLIGRFIR